MSRSFFLSLREGATLTSQRAGEIVLRYRNWTTSFKRVSPANGTALQRLGRNGDYEHRLTEGILDADGAEALAKFYFYLRQLEQLSLLRRSVYFDEVPLATLTPISLNFEYPNRIFGPNCRYQLSRFAYVRAEAGEMMLESPLSHGRIILHDWRATALVHTLGTTSVEPLSAPIPGLSGAATNLLMSLFENAEMLTERNSSGALEDRNSSLRSWEFHDLLFHSRSRGGRHDLPAGASFRFVGQLDQPHALRLDNSSEGIDLYRPDLERCKREDPPFALVQETRRSIREFDKNPITLEQLAEFLYRVARVTEHQNEDVETPAGRIMMEFAARPYPAGGILHELELYVAVRSCENLVAGIYRYDGENHRLKPISHRPADLESLLSHAGHSTGIPSDRLQILIIISSRFQRLSWKYASMAYALTLKHVGVLYQTMYLVATAMGLAPCAVGSGDADLFARAAGTNYYDETSVGEFVLGSKRKNNP